MEFVYLGTFIASCIIFYKRGVGKTIGPWKAIGVSIVSILLVMLLFILLDFKFLSNLIIVSTIICSVFVTSRYYEYLMETIQRQRSLYIEKRRE